MPEITVESIVDEKDALSRSCRVKVNHSTILTPTRAVGVTHRKRTELDALRQTGSQKYHALGEFYTKLSIDQIDRIAHDDEFGRSFSTRMTARIAQLRESGAVPHIVLALVDEAGNPFGKVPQQKIRDLLFDLLWGTEGNQFIVPPLLGALNSEKEYLSYIQALESRMKASTSRRDLPIAALIPSVYRLVAPRVVKRYWDMGCRLFAVDLESKKFGAFGYVIERLHLELTEMSKRDKEPYILHAINAKQRMGRGENMRVNDLLASGYGFDSFGPSHGSRRRWIPQPSDVRPETGCYLFDTRTYRYVPLDKAARLGVDPKAKGAAEDIKDKCQIHNVQRTFQEIYSFPDHVEDDGLLSYFSSKNGIRAEVDEMRLIADKSLHRPAQRDLEDWFE